MARVLTVHPSAPDPEAIAQAAALIKRGDLVAFPTETVYGLGANALDAHAVEKIYEAKGRPAHNPIIVHVSSMEQAKSLTSEWTPNAEKLAQEFWPGPLTLVLKKSAIVPDIVTAGGPTVAIRMPQHAIAHALIKGAGTPIAAPSANRSGSISAVTAQHVANDLLDIPMILDGGHVSGGIESTVIDVSSDVPRLLRPGLLSIESIEAIIGSVSRRAEHSKESPLASPGMLEKHYAPHTRTVQGNSNKFFDDLNKGKRIGILLFKNTKFVHENCIVVAMPQDPVAYAHMLYDTLHDLDRQGLDMIVVEMPPETDEWMGIRDRLTRATA